MSLESRITAQIHKSGPISLYNFMTLALYDPEDGYYAQKSPIGRGGDYITAPEMTQVFGEVIALWIIDLWQQANRPLFHLIEMGPGRGTLMADILRTFLMIKIPLPQVHLIEVSPILKEAQQKALQTFATNIFWHKDLSTLPQDQGFCFMVANEFWDALPIQQFVKVKEEWVERQIGASETGLVFLPEQGTLIQETCPAMPSLVNQISQHLKTNHGAALFLDYGYDLPDATGDTLQALHHHQRQDSLINVGQADLTHHVDFHQLKTLFEEAELKVYGSTPQGEFLNAIGLEVRTQMLVERANPQQKGALQTAWMRLTHPTQMGTLFKAICVLDGSKLKPMGFTSNPLSNLPR